MKKEKKRKYEQKSLNIHWSTGATAKERISRTQMHNSIALCQTNSYLAFLAIPEIVWDCVSNNCGDLREAARLHGEKNFTRGTRIWGHIDLWSFRITYLKTWGPAAEGRVRHLKYFDIYRRVRVTHLKYSGTYRSASMSDPNFGSSTSSFRMRDQKTSEIHMTSTSGPMHEVFFSV